jgi:RNA polymerase sigma factor (sigma-70 family)
MESEIRQSRCAPIKREGRYLNVENRAVDGGTMRAFGRISGEAGDDQRHFALFDTIADSSPGPQERAVSTIARERVRAVLARFDVNEREAAILREHVCEDVPLQVLAERFGVTKQRMGQIKTDLLRRMEVSFEPEEGRR